MAKRGNARSVRLTCPKCSEQFSVVAFISKGIDASTYWKARAEDHDCEVHAKVLAAGRSGEGTKNPLKASKAAMRNKK
jgi:hypothetical protein